MFESKAQRIAIAYAEKLAAKIPDLYAIDSIRGWLEICEIKERAKGGLTKKLDERSFDADNLVCLLFDSQGLLDFYHERGRPYELLKQAMDNHLRALAKHGDLRMYDEGFGECFRLARAA